MDKIKIIDENACNNILNKYRGKYYYDYKKDCFVDRYTDIGLQFIYNKVRGKKNIFALARTAGYNALSKKVKELKSNKKLPKERFKKCKDAYKIAYNKKIVSPYNSFTQNKSKSDAYQLAKYLDVKVCPYCNINYIYVVDDLNDSKFICRPDFDHFYSKSEHPEYQLRLCNLVPSCPVCNRTIKRDKEFDERNYLNPYKLSFDEIKYFDIEFIHDKSNDEKSDIKNITDEECLLSILEQEVPEDNFKIVFKNREKMSQCKIRKADGNIKAFELEARYQHHKDVVIDIFRKAKMYNRFRLQEISDILENDNMMLYASLFSEVNCEINKTSLGKLKRDIILEYVLT